MIRHYKGIQIASKTKFPSVQTLETLAKQDPVIKMNLELAIDDSKATLKGHSIQQFLELINRVIQEPPFFTLLPLIGAPINIICCEMMQTPNGRNLFSNPTFNSSVVSVLKDYNQFLKTSLSLKYFHSCSP